jgi:hypothetical protein
MNLSELEWNEMCSKYVEPKKTRLQRIYLWFKHKWWSLVGFCPQHGEYWQYPKKYRRNTAYVDDQHNWGYSPKCCQDEEYEYYQELWRDVYSGIL